MRAMLAALAATLLCSGCVGPGSVATQYGAYKIEDKNTDVIWVTRQFTDPEGRQVHALMACYRSPVFAPNMATPVCFTARTAGDARELYWGPQPGAQR